MRRVGISLDGPTPAVHDRFRGFSGSFKRTMEVVQRVACPVLALQVNTTVPRHNLSTLKAPPAPIPCAGPRPSTVLYRRSTRSRPVQDMVCPDNT